MIIDTHNHVSPDKVADIIAKKVEREGLKLEGSFRLQELLSTRDRCGIDVSILFNIAEKPSVVQSSNDFLASVCDGQKLIGMGSIHPDYEDFEDEINRLKAMGFRGVKFNSSYQDFFVDEERMLKIYQKLSDNDMIAYFHVGKDPASPEAEAQTSPQGLARVLEMFPKLKVVAAHYGGLKMLEESEKYLVGKNLYLDTSWDPSVEMLNPEEITRLIKKHGLERIFFGSDYPFTNVQKQINWLLKLPISTEEKERIFWKNASEFFGIYTTSG